MIKERRETVLDNLEGVTEGEGCLSHLGEPYRAGGHHNAHTAISSGAHHLDLETCVGGEGHGEGERE